MLCMVVAYTTTCTYTLHTFVMPVVPFPLFIPIMVVLPTLLFSDHVLYVCYFVCVCVCVCVCERERERELKACLGQCACNC